jgi:hypothetical protein
VINYTVIVALVTAGFTGDLVEAAEETTSEGEDESSLHNAAEDEEDELEDGEEVEMEDGKAASKKWVTMLT